MNPGLPGHWRTLYSLGQVLMFNWIIWNRTDLTYEQHTYVLWPRKGSLMKTQTRILDNKLYYTRKIELHRKGKKSRTVRITPILICGICCSADLTGKCGTRPFFGGSGRRTGAHTCPAFLKMPMAPWAFPY